MQVSGFLEICQQTSLKGGYFTSSMTSPLMEVCVDSIESALCALAGGASRLELCSSLSEGGLTPSPGTLKLLKQLCDAPINVMLRPRAGLDYCYTSLEIEALQFDMDIFVANGADGFVFGALTPEKKVDVPACIAILKTAGQLPVTFHRAIDVSRDLKESLEAVIELGFQRVLTSGGEDTALLGLSRIKELVTLADERIVVMPGAGINKSNLREILSAAGITEFHGSAKVEKSGKFVTCSKLVREMVDIAEEFNL